MSTFLTLFLRNFALISIISISAAYAEDSLELSTSSISTANIFFWAAGFIGILVGFLVHKWMHKNHMANDVWLPVIPALFVTWLVVYSPHFFGAPSDFTQACFQTITDSDGKVRESIDLANECALSREEVSAWGIAPVISGYKGAFGYTSSDRYLSTGTVYFFYFLVTGLWVLILYMLALFVNRKLKN